MPSSSIVLVGAPLAEHLDWSETSLTAASTEPFAINPASSTETSTSLSDQTSKWRVIPSSSHALPAVYSSVDDTTSHPDLAHQTLSDLNTAVDEACSNQNELDDGSVAFLEHLDTSELSPMRLTHRVGHPHDDAEHSFYSALTDSGLFDETSDPTSSSPQLRELSSIAYTDLLRLPGHDYLRRISPQTVTVDLVVAIIAIRPTKTVQLRRRNTQMDIIELIVGDETRAGFGINVWLATQSEERHTTDLDLARALRILRPGDLVGFRNVGLSSFREVVHGQTLNKRFTRTSTTLTRINRAIVTSANASQKVKSVYEWSLRFINPSETDRRHLNIHDRTRSGENELLPPDTPSDP